MTNITDAVKFTGNSAWAGLDEFGGEAAELPRVAGEIDAGALKTLDMQNAAGLRRARDA